jgi:hypothetical protein
MTSFAPFKNESDAITLGDLKIENREDHVAIYGRLAVTRDRAGLAAAKALKDIADRIVKELENGPPCRSRSPPQNRPRRSRTHSREFRLQGCGAKPERVCDDAHG